MFKSTLSKIPIPVMVLLMTLTAFQVNAELIDPTRPGNFSMLEISGEDGAQAPDRLVIQAIYYRSSGSSVMINGHRYRVNDQVAEYTVRQIMPNQVILEGSEGEKTISFNRMPVKFKEEAEASQVKD